MHNVTAIRPEVQSPNPGTHMVDSASSFKLCSDLHKDTAAFMCVYVYTANKLFLMNVRCMWPVKLGETVAAFTWQWEGYSEQTASHTVC